MEYPVTVNGVKVFAQYTRRSVDEIFLPLLQALFALQHEKGRRILVMLAAPPGSGKSTLLSFLESLSHGSIQVIGMDGFHRRQEYLVSHYTERNGRQIPMVDIKGAPITFDLELLTAGIKRIAAGETCGWPVYDRMLHNPVEDAVLVDGDIILLEGNYLLLDQDGWRDLSGYADYTISIRADESLLRSRLIDRRIKTGVEEAAATRFVDYSDMPNVRLCLEKTARADCELWIDERGDYHKRG
ncbi:MAG: nucleoside/nucleotide kinase family protein [Clostridia bacterium]|nr:nucleoside/nucleotide kinase family protein [Clostridia bacterium]MBR3272488.1 nucleoside/nucleotide kinase family protein [Clostridia bacterium]